VCACVSCVCIQNKSKTVEASHAPGVCALCVLHMVGKATQSRLLMHQVCVPGFYVRSTVNLLKIWSLVITEVEGATAVCGGDAMHRERAHKADRVCCVLH